MSRHALSCPPVAALATGCTPSGSDEISLVVPGGIMLIVDDDTVLAAVDVVWTMVLSEN